MGAKRVIWHVGFERNLRRRGPPSFEVRSEVPLSVEVLRLLPEAYLRALSPEVEAEITASPRADLLPHQVRVGPGEIAAAYAI